MAKEIKFANGTPLPDKPRGGITSKYSFLDIPTVSIEVKAELLAKTTGQVVEIVEQPSVAQESI